LEAQEHVLINKGCKGKFTINFMGAFPQNKWAMPNGKIYLNDKEMDFVKATYPHVLGKQLVLEGQEPEVKKEDDFFKLHHTQWKSQVAEMSIEEVESKLAEANEKGIEGKIVEALKVRQEELSE
jgi:hypothetical protein